MRRKEYKGTSLTQEKKNQKHQTKGGTKDREWNLTGKERKHHPGKEWSRSQWTDITLSWERNAVTNQQIIQPPCLWIPEKYFLIFIWLIFSFRNCIIANFFFLSSHHFLPLLWPAFKDISLENAIRSVCSLQGTEAGGTVRHVLFNRGIELFSQFHALHYQPLLCLTSSMAPRI